MANDYDSKLLESATVRHKRLDEALVFGANLYQRKWDTVLRRVLFSILIAALIAAICVGYSFVHSILGKRKLADGPSAGLSNTVTLSYAAPSNLTMTPAVIPALERILR